MKISKEQKLKNRKALIASAVSVITDKGFKSASMREIAQNAKLSDAAIYKYFPTKEALLYGYFEDSLHTTLKSLKEIKGFDEFRFVEQMHLLVEKQLEYFENNKGFVSLAFKEVFTSSLKATITDTTQHREQYLNFVGNYLQASVHAGEFPKPPNIDFLTELFWDWQIGIVYYWLKDNSKNHENTTQVLDKSLALFEEVLSSGILAKLTDLAFFFIRNHLFDRIGHLNELSAPQRIAKKKFLTKNKGK